MTPERMRDVLLPRVNPYMRELGYRKKATTWHQETPDLIRVLNLQKSQYSDNYYVNVGLYIKEIRRPEDPPLPPEYRTHAKLRADDLLGRAEADGLQGWPEGQTLAQRAEIIINLVQLGAPWLSEFSTLEDFRKIDPTNYRIGVHVMARRLLENRGIWPPSQLTGNL